MLSRNAREEDARRLLEESRLVKDPGEIENIGAVVHVSANANRELFNRIAEDKEMADVIREIFADEFKKSEEEGMKKGKAEGIKEGKAEGVKEGKTESIKQLMQNMKWTAEQAMNALGISLKDQKKYMTLL